MPTHPDQLQSALAERYLIEREIGRGGMATVQLGLHDRALDCLEKAALNGAGHRAWIENNPDLNAIRHHPRFQEFLNKI